LSNVVCQIVYYEIERKLNPEDDWQSLPSYLPKAGELKVDAPETYGRTSTSKKFYKVADLFK